MGKKVSIITPCLNGEKFVHRYLESVLNQTYKNLELIFINDGSTDKTEAVVKSYIAKFQQNGMNLIYIFQKNAGQAAAINVGLKLFTGEYLTWPDSDDFLSIDSIEKKVDFLEQNKEYGLVRTDAYIFNEGDIIKPIGTISGKNPNRFNEKIFEDLLSEDTYCWNGCYMLRSSAFLDVNPKGEIYASTAGQNFQMLLPIVYKYKCGYIDESLYNYVVRNDSHSHLDENVNLQTSLIKNSNHQNILMNVINSMEIDKAFYTKLIIAKYARRKMALALTYKNSEILVQQYEILRKMGVLNQKDKITYARGISFIFNLIYRITAKITRIVRKISKQLPWRY